MKIRLVTAAALLAGGLILLATVDARGEWEMQQNPIAGASLRAVQAVNAKEVWVGGSGGSALRTLDGGQTWEKLDIPDAGKLDFRGVAAFDAATAVFMSSGEAEKDLARICRTADGGKTWNVVFETQEKGVFLDCIRFWDDKNGLVCGDSIAGKWYLLRTKDGGLTWERVKSESLPEMQKNEGAFAASNTSMMMLGSSKVWIASGAADRARVFFSGDLGQTWRVTETPMPSSEAAGIFSIRFWDAQHGVGVGGDYKKFTEPSDNVIITDDGGASWRKGGATDPPGLKEGVVTLTGGVLLAVGPSGTSMSKDSGNSWQKVDSTPFHAASCAAGQCWAAGGKGAIARWK